MLYDNGNHSPTIPPLPYAQPQSQRPQRPTRPGLGGRPTPYGMGAIGQGSYADYYNGMPSPPTPPPVNTVNPPSYQPGDSDRYSYWMNQQQQGIPQLRPMPRYGMRFGRRPRYNQQFDINGRPRGAWDYQEPQPQPFYSAVPY